MKHLITLFMRLSTRIAKKNPLSLGLYFNIVSQSQKLFSQKLSRKKGLHYNRKFFDSY